MPNKTLENRATEGRAMVTLSSLSSPSSALIFALAALGTLSLLRALRAASSWVWRYFLRPGKTLTSYGTWAVITGCTDGIGKAFSMELARQGLNLVLISRSREKLEAMAAEITAKHRVEVQSFAMDFFMETEEVLDSGMARVSESVAGLDVGILVNNAGISYPYARFFHEVDPELARRMLRINVGAVVRMVQLVLPGMIKRKRGAILNLGSGSASVLPSDPLYALYAGTKGFVEKFSRSLHLEYKKKGIDVQCQAPLLVTTKLASIRRPSFFAPTPDAYARSGIKWIGYEPLCSPYWTHSLIWKVVEIVPRPLFDMVRLKQSIDVRKRGKAKDARKKDEFQGALHQHDKYVLLASNSSRMESGIPS